MFLALYCLRHRYPVNAFVVEIDAATHATASREERAAVRAEVAQLAGTACMRLAAMNQPHNLLICEAGRRVFLFPQVRGHLPGLWGRG